MENIQGYAIQIQTKLDFTTAIAEVTKLLQEEGFGILTEIDVTGTFKKKLDLDYKPYRILGACNPPFAHRSLEAVPQIGVLLPCNVVVWDEGDHRVVAAMEPLIMSQVLQNETVNEVAVEVSERIHRVMEKMESA